MWLLRSVPLWPMLGLAVFEEALDSLHLAFIGGALLVFRGHDRREFLLRILRAMVLPQRRAELLCCGAVP